MPFVNYNNLLTRESLCDLYTKHYEVIYPTTRGGYIFACFADYDSAFAYAYDIERRYVEIKDDAVYYKSLNNPNQKVVYPTDSNAGKIALTRAINTYARQNVEVAYFDASEEFTYTTYESTDSLIENIESLSFADSIHVTPQEEKEKLYNRAFYVNNFQFIKVEDYDVVEVVATRQEDESEIPIKFDQIIDKQLEQAGVYTIQEKNSYGNVREYDVIYMPENKTASTWDVTINGTTKALDVSSESHEDISVDSLVLKDIKNDLDGEAIVKISSSAYDYVLTGSMDEIRGLCLDKEGTYKIKFIDRVGNNYSFNVNVSGKNYTESTVNSYVDVYNSIYIQKRDK